MKKLLILTFAAFLCACIAVEDLGTYWEKGTLDTRLFGTWQSDKKSDMQAMVIVRDGDNYRIDSNDAQERGKKDYKPIFARTLQAPEGNAFLMVCEDPQHPKAGDLIRYKISGDELEIYILNESAMRALLKDKYPKAANIRVSEGDGSVSVGTLDDETFAILSAIPDNDSYWRRDETYKKVP